MRLLARRRRDRGRDVGRGVVDVDATGAFAGKLPATGAYLLRAEVKDVGRSNVLAAGTGRAPSPSPSTSGRL